MCSKWRSQYIMDINFFCNHQDIYICWIYYIPLVLCRNTKAHFVQIAIFYAQLRLGWFYRRILAVWNGIEFRGAWEFGRGQLLCTLGQNYQQFLPKKCKTPRMLVPKAVFILHGGNYPSFTLLIWKVEYYSSYIDKSYPLIRNGMIGYDYTHYDTISYLCDASGYDILAIGYDISNFGYNIWFDMILFDTISGRYHAIRYNIVTIWYNILTIWYIILTIWYSWIRYDFICHSYSNNTIQFDTTFQWLRYYTYRN